MSAFVFTSRRPGTWFLSFLVTISILLGSLQASAVEASVSSDLQTENTQCGVNLLQNGSFESPVIANSDGWDIFDSVINGLSWVVNWVSPTGAPEPAKLELQGNYYMVSDGVQYAELDSNWYPAPGLGYSNGEDSRVKITQVVKTLPGQEYEFSFDFSARPGYGPEDNLVEVWINGVVVDTQSGSGIGNTNNVWAPHSYTFTATGDATEVGLSDAGAVNSFGSLVDNVALTCKLKEQPGLYRISGYKFKESGDSDGILADWTINLEDADGNVVGTTNTNADGYYYFDVETGYYEVHEAKDNEWEQVKVLRNNYQTQTEGEGYCSFSIPEPESDYTCDFYNKYIGENPSSTEITTEKKHSQTSGTRVKKRPTPQVLGASTQNTCTLISDYMQMGWNNDAVEVKKLQMFLNKFKDTFGGSENPITGFFGPITKSNVKTFQEHYKSDILDPWFIKGIVPHSNPTGFVYKTTKWKINQIVCSGTEVFPILEGENLTTNIAIN